MVEKVGKIEELIKKKQLLRPKHYADFIGKEFLTWLLYKFMNGESIFAVDGESIEVNFLEKIHLENPHKTSKRDSHSGGAPVFSFEVAVELWEGKKVTSAKIALKNGTDRFKFYISADQYYFRYFSKITGDFENEREEIDANSSRFLRAFTLFNGIYNEFLNLRTSNRWLNNEVPNIKHWIGINYIKRKSTDGFV